MKIVTTRVKAEWSGSCPVPDAFVTDEQLENQKEKIKEMILSELGISEYCDYYDIKVEYDVEDIGGVHEEKIKK